MKIILIGVGKIRTAYLREGCDDYARRIRKMAPVEIREIKPAGKKDAEAAKKNEGAKIVDMLDNAGWKTAALHDSGKALGSKEFARFIKGIEASGSGGLAFVIGGAWGLSEEVLSRVDVLLSLGPMTMSHELARLVLLEQIYRARSILSGAPYAK